MTLLIVKKDFTVGGNSFRRGEYYKFDTESDRNRAGWLTITNRNFEFKTGVPGDLVIKVGFSQLAGLASEGFLTLALIDRTEGPLTKA